MKIVIASISMLLLVFLTGYKSSERPDFSGKWELNKAKTLKESGFQRSIPKTRQVQQTKEGIEITITIKGTQSTAKYTFDGKETESSEDGTKKLTKASWSPDGKQLSFYSAYFNGDTPTGVERLETWQLKDGSLYITATNPSWGQASIEVYDK